MARRDQQRRELSLGACRRLEAHGVQPGDLGEVGPEGHGEWPATPGGYCRLDRGAGRPVRASPPDVRSAWGCTSWCTTPAGRSWRRSPCSAPRGSCNAGPHRARSVRVAEDQPRLGAGGESGRRAGVRDVGPGQDGRRPAGPAGLEEQGRQVELVHEIQNSRGLMPDSIVAKIIMRVRLGRATRSKMSPATRGRFHPSLRSGLFQGFLVGRGEAVNLAAASLFGDGDEDVITVLGIPPAQSDAAAGIPGGGPRRGRAAGSFRSESRTP